jgi:hypothetical protein
MPIVLSAYWKNLFSLFAAFELNNKGLYGPARFLIRHSFEFLILAKYCAVKNDSSLVKKWEGGDPYISLSKHVFKKTKKPASDKLKAAWRLLCQFSHASVFSMQLGFEEYDGFDKNVEDTYVYIQIMLECNYHLLNACLVNREMHHLIGLYSPVKDAEAKKARKDFKELIRKNKNQLPRQARSLINDYKLKLRYSVIAFTASPSAEMLN